MRDVVHTAVFVSSAISERRDHEPMKIDSLTENHLFSRAYRKGTCSAGSFTVVYRLAHGKGKGVRLGITVGKKLGGAVERNRAKRLIREAYYRICKEYSPADCVLVVVARSRICEKTTKTDDVYSDMKRSLLKLGVIGDAI